MPTAEEVTLRDVGQFIAWTKELKPRPIPDDKIGLNTGNSIVLVDLTKQIKEGKIAGIKSKFTIFIHAHYVNCKLITSQERDSRPKMWR